MYRLTNKQAGLSVQLTERESLFTQLLKDPAKHKDIGGVYELVKDTAKKLLQAFTCNLHSLSVCKRIAKRRSYLDAQIEAIKRKIVEYDDCYQNYLATAGSMINSSAINNRSRVEVDDESADEASVTTGSVVS